MNEEMKKKVAALDELIRERSKLDFVRKKAGGFNVFRVLRLQEAEIRHSNVLAWLLDPEADHGIGEKFLREFLISLTGHTDLLNASEAYFLDFTGVRVFREFHNMDIIVEFPKAELVLVIENKIRSVDSPMQLQRYREGVAGSYNGYRKLLIYLTLDGSTSDYDSDYWISISYSDTILSALHSVLESKNLAGEQKVLVEHYSEIISDLTMENEELVKICKDLYARHKDAIDLIHEYGTQIDFTELESALRSASEPAGLIVQRGKSIWFIPKVLEDELRTLDREAWSQDSWPLDLPIAFWFYIDNRPDPARLQLNIEVGPIRDQEKRRKLLESLAQQGFDNAKNPKGPKYTRITKKMVKNIENNDSVYLADVGREMYDEAVKQHLKKILDAIAAVQ